MGDERNLAGVKINTLDVRKKRLYYAKIFDSLQIFIAADISTYVRVGKESSSWYSHTLCIMELSHIIYTLPSFRVVILDKNTQEPGKIVRCICEGIYNRLSGNTNGTS